MANDLLELVSANATLLVVFLIGITIGFMVLILETKALMWLSEPFSTLIDPDARYRFLRKYWLGVIFITVTMPVTMVTMVLLVGLLWLLIRYGYHELFTHGDNWTILLLRLWWLWFFQAAFTSIWFWLYAGSGFIIKAARRFDAGLDWFDRHFDIEKKPLQSIGLVAGALVAVLYWTAVIVSRMW